mgnify:CR=1 FL=1
MSKRSVSHSRPQWSAQELTDITSGRLVGIDPAARIVGICTDSRTLESGEAFLAFRGERFDGAEFATDAVTHGAVLVIAERELPGLPTLVVDSCVDAYAAIARDHLERLRETGHVKVVAITGSSGKTSTKDMLVSVLSSCMRVAWPEGSFNNDIGLPATVLTADEFTQVLVLEMGMRGLGHIERLCSIAPPDICVVLNVGLAHVGEVGSIEAIAEAKSEIVRFARQSAVTVLNADDQRVRPMAALAHGAVVFFGREADDASDGAPQVYATDVMIDSQARASFTLSTGTAAGSSKVQLHVSGEHQVMNALAVAAVAHILGFSTEQTAAALSAARISSAWRMDVVSTRTGVTVVNDSYNANPQSMAAGLRAAATMSRGGRLIAVLGDMLELGDSADAEHQRLGQLATDVGVDALYFVGDCGLAVKAGFSSAVTAETWQQAAAHVKNRAQSGDIVFIKASRGVGLERVAAELINAFGRVDS